MMRAPYLARLEAHLGPRFSTHTRRAYLSQSRAFLTSAGVKLDYNREDVLTFIDGMLTRGLRADSIATVLAGVRVFFDVNGLRWPLTRNDMRLGLPDEEPNAPTLTRKEVAYLIYGVRDTPGFPRSVVALATTYGLRRDEINAVIAKGCDGLVLDVQTAKGGKKRHHVIPPLLGKPLTFAPVTCSVGYLHSLFGNLMREYVREPAPGEGWHAIRRSLVTELLENGVGEESIVKWMGWRSTNKSMAIRYFHPNMGHLERAVMTNHPFLIHWKV